jgi:hypothetical protein
MTLILTIIAPFGIWQASDNLLTDPKTREPQPVRSSKFICLEPFPGQKAILSYAGIGTVKYRNKIGIYSEIQISDWLLEIFRGEQRDYYQTLIHLRDHATQSLGPMVKEKFFHVFSLVTFIQSSPWLFEVHNLSDDNSRKGSKKFLGEFSIASKRITKPELFSAGDRAALTKKDIDTIFKRIAKPPKNPNDFCKLLANYIKVASNNSKDKLISSSCTTLFLSPTGEPIQIKKHNDEASVPPMRIPYIFLGIDLNELALGGLKFISDSRRTGVFDEETFLREQEKFGKKSVEYNNRFPHF